MTPQEILLALQEHKTKSYSGRGMYGKQCFSVVGEQKSIQEDIMNVLLEMDYNVHDWRDTAESIKELLSTYTIDSMGKSDIVMYWRDIPWEGESSNEDED